MLAAFDRLFAKTAEKLNVAYTPEELVEAEGAFAERMAKIMDVLEDVPFDFVPDGSVAGMEAAIGELTPAQVVGQMATVPLLQHSQGVLQHLAYQAAEHRFVEHALGQADTTYGGN